MDRLGVPARASALEERGVEVVRVPAEADRLSIAAVVALLAERGITRLMVEGGPTVAAAFLAADLVDEVALFRSAKVIGPGGIDALQGLPLEALTQRLELQGSAPVGEDSVEFFARA